MENHSFHNVERIDLTTSLIGSAGDPCPRTVITLDIHCLGHKPRQIQFFAADDLEHIQVNLRAD